MTIVALNNWMEYLHRYAEAYSQQTLVLSKLVIVIAQLKTCMFIKTRKLLSDPKPLNCSVPTVSIRSDSVCCRSDS